MFPMEPMEKLASLSANFQKSSKVSISATLFKVLKDLAEIWPPWACLVNKTMCFDVLGKAGQNFGQVNKNRKYTYPLGVVLFAVQ